MSVTTIATIAEVFAENGGPGSLFHALRAKDERRAAGNEGIGNRRAPRICLARQRGDCTRPVYVSKRGKSRRPSGR
jgi:hypothetical protein